MQQIVGFFLLLLIAGFINSMFNQNAIQRQRDIQNSGVLAQEPISLLERASIACASGSDAYACYEYKMRMNEERATMTPQEMCDKHGQTEDCKAAEILKRKPKGSMRGAVN